MKVIHFFVLASAINAEMLSANTTMEIGEAARKGLVKIIIKGKGGYTGDVIQMKIQNMTHTGIVLKMNAGRRLDSQNNGEQDILVTKQENFSLAPDQQKSYNVYGMCCQAHNSSPEQNSIYSIGSMADSNLVKMASYIDQNKYYTNYAAQQSVWVISDNNSLASIEAGKKEDVVKLRNFVSHITGRTIPQYDIIYKQQDDRSVLGRAIKVEGVFAYSLNIDNKVTIAIYDNDGKLVQTLMERYPHAKGDYKLAYVFNTYKLPSGSYYTRMITDGAVIKEERIDI